METSPATLLRKARHEAGLSARALAAKAGVPTTTVTRIENGSTDPGFTTLCRLLGAAGFDLEVTTRPRSDVPTTLASLATAVEVGEDRLRIDWTRLRAFADWCRRHPGEVPGAIADVPRRTQTAFDAILAGFAELLAEAVGVEAPAWTRSVPAPSEPWALPGTPAMLARVEASCPDAFRRRNVILGADAIFREPEPPTDRPHEYGSAAAGSGGARGALR